MIWQRQGHTVLEKEQLLVVDPDPIESVYLHAGWTLGRVKEC